MFKNKVVIITGASSGIGRALAVEFSRRGAHVVLAARNLENLVQTKMCCEQHASRVIIVQTDVTVESECRELVDKTINEFGRIDVFISNAGVSMRALFSDLDIRVLKHLMDVNFWGTVYCCKYALPHLLDVKGSFVGVTSIGGYRGLPGRTGYSASKFALRGFLETLRTEHLRTGLHVLTVAPSYTASDIRKNALTGDGSLQARSPRDESKMMTADKAAYKIIRSVEKKRIIRTITLYGRLIVWMNRFFPRMMDKIVFRELSKEPDSPFK